MELLWLALIVQMTYYIVYDAHIAIVVFIVLSALMQLFSKNPYVFLLGPMVCAHVGYVYMIQDVENDFLEGFRRRKFGGKRWRRHNINPRRAFELARDKSRKRYCKGAKKKLKRAKNELNIANTILKEYQELYGNIQETVNK